MTERKGKERRRDEKEGVETRKTRGKCTGNGKGRKRRARLGK